MEAHHARVLLLVAPLLLAGCVTPDESVAPAADIGTTLPLDADGFVDLAFEGIAHLKADFESPVGGVIHAEYYVPANLGDAKVPVILEVTPYNLGSEHRFQTEDRPSSWSDRVHRYVERGYAVAYVDARGFGGSTGCWDYYGDDEMADAVAAVEWFASQPWSTGKVGMVGTSYPGTTQLLAAVGQAQGLAAIVPVAPEPSVYENQFKNGVQYRNGQITSSAIYAALYPGIAAAPPGTNVAAYPGYVQGRADTPPCLLESTASLMHPDALYDDYMEERDRQDDAHLVEAAVLWTHGFWDQNVKPDEFVPMWQDIEAPKRAWFWHGYHERPGDAAGRGEDFADQEHRWLDHWLHGVENGVMDLPAVEVQDSLGRWRYEETWPPADAGSRFLYPTTEGVLHDAPQEGSVAFTTDPLTSFGGFIGDDDPGRGLVDRVPAGAHHTSVTEPLTEPLHVAGTTLYHLRLSIDQPRGQVVVGLFDVAPDGRWTVVDRGALDLRHREGMDHVVDVVPGEVMDLTFDGWPTDWVFEAGHRIGVVVVGTEARYVTADNGHTVSLTLGEGTSVELPVVPARTDFFATTESSALTYRERMDAPEGVTLR